MKALVLSHAHPAFSIGGAQVASYNLFQGLKQQQGWATAQDARGDAFSFPATPPSERLLEEYLYAAVVIQAAPGPSGVEPISRGARRLVRNHVIIAHTTSTIIITLAVSVVITALT